MIEQHDALKVTGGLFKIMRGNHHCHIFLFESIQ